MPLSLDDSASGATLGPAEAERRERRRMRMSLLGLGLILAVFVGAFVLLRKSQEYDPTVVGGRVVLYAVLALNIVLILAIAVTLFRNLFKLFFEWRRDMLGSRLAIKLVIAFLAQGFIPTGLLFIAGSEIIDLTTAQWLSPEVDQVTDAALRLARRHRADQDARALAVADEVAGALSRDELLALENRAELLVRLRPMLSELDAAGITVIVPGSAPLEVADPRKIPFRAPEIPVSLVLRWQRGERFVHQRELPEGRGTVRWAGVPVPASGAGPAGVVVVSQGTDTALVRDERLVTAAREDYTRRVAAKGFIVATNVSILLLITLLLLLGSVWMGLVMARGVTVPIRSLAEATRAVGGGNLDVRVSAPAGDELKMLLDSFNRMTQELGTSKIALERTVAELRASNDALGERRLYIETVLDTVAAGVLTWDRQGCLTTANPAAARLLRLPGNVLGRPLHEVLDGEALGGLRELVHGTLAGSGPRAEQVAVLIGASERMLQAITTPLRSLRDGSLAGAVLALEDVTELLKAQQASAWREVARRMAHEIKNPLTPIQISAERITMKVADLTVDPADARVIQDGCRMILEEVRTLKTLVDEFSRFARLPKVTLRQAALNDVVSSAAALYENVLAEGRLVLDLDGRLGQVPLDPEQLRRAIVNLVDNAVAAMGGAGVVTLATRLDPELAVAVVEVADTGPGIPLADRPKLFLPHFSTKKRGTGLGLAIVDRIVSDHGGYVRVEDNLPAGARFVIELPLRRLPDVEAVLDSAP